MHGRASEQIPDVDKEADWAGSFKLPPSAGLLSTEVFREAPTRMLRGRVSHQMGTSMALENGPDDR